MLNQPAKRVVLPVMLISILLVSSLIVGISTAQILVTSVNISSFGTISYTPIDFEMIIDSPQHRYYTAAIVPMQLISEADEPITWNIYNGINWLYKSNQIYTSPTQVILDNGEYELHVWVNGQIVDNVVFGVNLRNIGSVYATGGSNVAIQAAVNSASSGYAVYLPGGTYVFDSASPWTSVNIPAGISIYGAPALRNANGFIETYSTILTAYDWAVPDSNIWFYYSGASESLTRFTGVKCIGYREMHPTYLTSRTTPFYWSATSELRFDHNYLKNTLGQSVKIGGGYGLVDHNEFVNTPFTHTTFTLWDDLTAWYAINYYPNHAWVDPYTLYGLYSTRTLVIENNYFEGWFTGVNFAGSNHVIVRYNDETNIGQLVTSHQEFTEGRAGDAAEIYNNKGSAISSVCGVRHFVNAQTGGHLVYNNIVSGYGTAAGDNFNALVSLRNYDLGIHSFSFIQDTYIWDNTMTNGNDIYDVHEDNNTPHNSLPVLNTDFFLRAPSLVQDGWAYIPYVYPHPLVGK